MLEKFQLFQHADAGVTFQKSYKGLLIENVTLLTITRISVCLCGMSVVQVPLYCSCYYRNNNVCDLTKSE